MDQSLPRTDSGTGSHIGPVFLTVLFTGYIAATYGSGSISFRR